MPFPNLALRPDANSPNGVAALWAEATGVPDPGSNTFSVPFINQPPLGSGIDPDLVVEDWLEINVDPLGAGVTGVLLGVPLLSPDKQFMTLVFAADGVAAARVVVQLHHTIHR
jgi:hypothetical protein